MEGNVKHDVADHIRSVYGIPLSATDDDVINYAHETDPDGLAEVTKFATSGPSGFADQHPILAGLQSAAERIRGVQAQAAGIVGPAAQFISKAYGASGASSFPPIHAAEQLAGAAGAIGKFANGGNQQLSDLMAENGGMTGALAGGALSSASSALLPTSAPAAALMALTTPFGGSPEVAPAPGEAALNAVREAPKTPTDVDAFVAGLNSTPTVREASNYPDKDLLVKSFAAQQGEKGLYNEAGKAAVEPSSLAGTAYSNAKEIASEAAGKAGTQLLNWFPRIGMADARKLAADPDMVNRAVPLEAAQEAYHDYSEANVLQSGRDAFTAHAKANGSSQIDYRSIADGAWNDLKNVDGSDFTKAQAQQALLGRQAYGEMLKNKWKNPALDYDENAARSMQSDLDDKLTDYDPKLAQLRTQYAEAVTVDKLNHVLPQNANMSPNKLQMMAVLAAAGKGAEAHGPLGALGYGLAAGAASSPMAWKAGLSAAGAAGRDVGAEGLATAGQNAMVPLGNALLNDKDDEKEKGK